MGGPLTARRAGGRLGTGTGTNLISYVPFFSMRVSKLSDSDGSRQFVGVQALTA